MSGITSVRGYDASTYLRMSSIDRTSSGSSQSLADDLQAASSASDGLGSTNLEDQIKLAIEEALKSFMNSNDSENADSDSTSSSTTMSFQDFMSVIKDAVDEVLKENGIDPESVSGQMPPPPPDGMQAGGQPPGPPPGPPPESDSDSSADSTYANQSLYSSGSTDSTGSTGSNDEIEKLIEAMQELIAKLQNSQDGNTAVSGYLFNQVS